MGTNYYHRVEGKEDRHIGKQSAGWAFHFRGYRKENEPDGFEIRSWEDWKNAILKEGSVYDEYERECDIRAWIQKVEAGKNNFQAAMFEDHLSWMDKDGWIFTLTDFC